MHRRVDVVRIRGILGTVVPVAVAVVAVLSRSAAGEDRPLSRVRSARVAQCSDAAIREIRFPHDIAVDEIRVEVHNNPGEPNDEQGPVVVSLSSGRWLRRLPVAPAAGQGLRFAPALTGDRFMVALDPSVGLHDTACVTRVTLLTGGRVVATIEP
jgi:hypothetical protein